MKISDLLALSFENLRRRFARTSLTIIGVVVGTCSIVVMVSLGIAMDEGFEEMIQQWGDLTQIQVYSWSKGGGEIPVLGDEVIAKFNTLEHVKVSTPLYNSRYLNAQVSAGKKDRYMLDYAQVVGIYPEAIALLEYELISGQYLPETTTALTGGNKKIQVLVGEKVNYMFRDTKKRGQNSQRYEGMLDAAGKQLPPFVDITKDPLSLLLGNGGGGGMAVYSSGGAMYSSNGGGGNSDTSKVLRYPMQVQGVMKEDYKKGYVTSSGIVMDLNLMKKLEKEYMKANDIKPDKNAAQQGYDNVIVKVDDVKNVEAVEKAIKDDFGYDTYSMSSEREKMQKQSQMIQLVLGGLGAVSLFVAALSIANTMTMAIYERTREIGVMKVLGCKLSKIRIMFLLEAAMIGFVGGLLGVVVSYVLSISLNAFGPMLMNAGLGNILPMYGSKISVIPPWLAALGVGFSSIIGILSGIMPANRAVKISALEAIRHE